MGALTDQIPQIRAPGGIHFPVEDISQRCAENSGAYPAGRRRAIPLQGLLPILRRRAVPGLTWPPALRRPVPAFVALLGIAVVTCFAYFSTTYPRIEGVGTPLYF